MPADADRPDPDRLLERVRNDEAREARGRLKIFFGAFAGVGKTFAMLAAARAARAQGQDVVVGVVQTHGRAETEAMLAGLPRLPMKAIDWRGRPRSEFDLDAALARRPALVLVDELAHSNASGVPGGSRHPKRWQDVEELLAQGIDVWTTMNVQHLDSLNDVVSGITGIRVRETVPDPFFDAADEVVIVDLPPDELLLRLRQGKVYLPHQAEQAVRNFFRKGNLIALRELALRRTADRVDDQVRAWRRDDAVRPVWRTRESLAVGIGCDPRDQALVRAASRLAAQLDVPWHAVHVQTPQAERLPPAARAQALATLTLARSLGAVTETLAGAAVAPTLARYARDHNLSKVVLGRRARPRRPAWRSGLADAVASAAAELDIVQIALPADAPGTAQGVGIGPAAAARSAIAWREHGIAVAAVGVAAIAVAPLHDLLELTNIVMVFLLAVVAVALRGRRAPAVLAAFLSVAAFDFLYVPPRFSFAVSDVQYLLTFAVMLTVALVIGQLTAGLSYQAQVARQREARMRSLYEMSRALSGALMPEQIAEIAGQFMAAQFQARTALLVADAADRLVPASAGIDDAQGTPLALDAGIAQWCFEHAQPAGLGTDTLPGSAVLYLPLRAPMRLRGVLALAPADPASLLAPDQRRLLDTGTSLLAIALERVHYVQVAQSTTVQVESERLRNSLLAAISHDLRTPLASLVALADSMSLTTPPPTAAQAGIARRIRDAAGRMALLVNNLLDMARLESGPVQLNRQWQPLEEVVGSALRTLGDALAARPVQVQLPEDLPLVLVDAVLIERVLANLLENAAKYTPAGSAIAIGARAEADAVLLWVDDHGPGLPAGREEALFNKFERGQRESATPGVGLGLAICRAIAEAHGGRIDGRTRPPSPADPGGARFTLRLPRGEPPPLPADDEEPLAADADQPR